MKNESSTIHYESNHWYNARGFLMNLGSSQPQTFKSTKQIAGSFLSLNDWCLSVQIDA